MILDTNALSAFIDGEPAVGVRLSAESQVAIPVIVLGEFRYGISGSRHRDKYERWLADHLSALRDPQRDRIHHADIRARSGIAEETRPSHSGERHVDRRPRAPASSARHEPR